jgi:predicted metalloprotease
LSEEETSSKRLNDVTDAHVAQDAVAHVIQNLIGQRTLSEANRRAAHLVFRIDEAYSTTPM